MLAVNFWHYKTIRGFSSARVNSIVYMSTFDWSKTPIKDIEKRLENTCTLFAFKFHSLLSMLYLADRKTNISGGM